MEQIPETPAPPAGVLLAGHFRELLGYRTWRPHGTHDWLLTLTLGGQGRYGFSGGELGCGRGDVVLLAPNTPHDYATAGNEAWDFVWVHFVPRNHWLPWLALPHRSAGLGLLALGETGVHARLLGAFERVLTDSAGVGAFSQDLALNALEEILIMLASRQARTAQQALDPRLELVIARLVATLDRSLRVEELAANVALSPSRLAHLFKAQFGQSIGQAHTILRLRHAARLLEFTSRSVSAIAQDVGYSSPFHFSHQFKARFGSSPQAYRNTCWMQDVNFDAASRSHYLKATLHNSFVEQIHPSEHQ